jgi:hypothetical protein
MCIGLGLVNNVAHPVSCSKTDNKDRDILTSMIDSIDQATWFYGKPISRLLSVLPSVPLSVLVPF